MRIFSTFPEAFNEIKRDLGEMGTRVKTTSMQDKDIQGIAGFETTELMNYVYTVTNPRLVDLKPTQPWADAEWGERWWGAEGHSCNPGKAHEYRPEIWDEFLHEGRFSYTYPERFASKLQVMNVINRLRQDRYSRQAYISMWQPEDSQKLGRERVPCSLGWHFIYRDDALHMTYFMRSCDFSTHFQNDVFLSLCLQKTVASRAGLTLGRFTHFISSLHVYEKDVADVF